MSLDVGSGRYAFRCLFEDTDPMTGPAVTVPGHVKGFTATVPVTNNELVGPAKEYQVYAAAGLKTLVGQAETLASDLQRGNLAAARRDWLPAHLTYETLGAAYDAFGNFDDEIDGRADALGVSNPQWTGFYRLEYGLWHGQSAAELTPYASKLVADVRSLLATWPTMEIPLIDIGLRTHEILENALEFQLTGHDDYGSGTTLATTLANIQGTRELLSLLHPLLVTRYPGLPGVYTWLNRLQTLLEAEHQPDGTWVPVSQLSGVRAPGHRRSVQPGAAGTRADRVHSRAEEHVMGDADKLPGRRSFLRGVAGGVAGGVVAGGAAGYAVRASQPEPAMAADTASLDGRLAAVPFHGRYQAGIVPPSQRQTAVISFDVTADSTSGLTDLFQTITSRARFLTAGGTPPPVGIDGPPSDSGVLGPTVVPDGLTVTFGVGSTLFDDRYGLASKLPDRLTPMQPFPNDDLDPAQTGGDLILQLSAGNADTVLHALRDIAKHTRGGMQINWRIDGFTSPARPSGTVPRNLMGFMDGIANPPLSKATELLWVQPGTAGEPDWTADGSYFVVRLIRMFVEFWDRVDVYEQQQMIGRDRATGFPMDARSLFAAPDFGADPTGAVIPVNAHIRLANPRTPQTASSRILRRAYNYDRGIDQVGDLDQGLIFTCFQQDVKRQFEAVQTRLIGEPLVDYISPFGGGYFLALPGVRDTADWYGRALLT